MRKTLLLSVVLLAALAVTCFAPAAAQKSRMTIQPNGDVTPSNAAIQRTGNTYTLTADLNYSQIVVEANNVIIDGANHTLLGPGVDQNLIALNLTATSVIVQNMQITNWKVGILGAWNNNTITSNMIRNSEKAIAVYANDYVIRQNVVFNCSTGLFIDGGAFRPQGDNNIVTQNQIRGNRGAFDIVNSNGTTITANEVAGNGLILVLATNTAYTLFYSNNFTGNGRVLQIPFGGFTVRGVVAFPAGQWDNGTVGNYWSDYRTIYPNATEIDGTGIGNTPYRIACTVSYTTTDENGAVVSGIAVLGTAVDNYPLMNQTQIAVSTAMPTLSPTVPEFPEQIAVFLLLAVICAVAFLTFKHLAKPHKT
jgi:nitrous oxidase accessory protein NosD